MTNEIIFNPFESWHAPPGIQTNTNYQLSPDQIVALGFVASPPFSGIMKGIGVQVQNVDGKIRAGIWASRQDKVYPGEHLIEAEWEVKTHEGPYRKSQEFELVAGRIYFMATVIDSPPFSQFTVHAPRLSEIRPIYGYDPQEFAVARPCLFLNRPYGEIGHPFPDGATVSNNLLPAQVFLNPALSQPSLS